MIGINEVWFNTISDNLRVIVPPSDKENIGLQVKLPGIMAWMTVDYSKVIKKEFPPALSSEGHYRLKLSAATVTIQEDPRNNGADHSGYPMEWYIKATNMKLELFR